jgi:hypothetical protein
VKPARRIRRAPKTMSWTRQHRLGIAFLTVEEINTVLIRPGLKAVASGHHESARIGAKPRQPVSGASTRHRTSFDFPNSGSAKSNITAEASP